MPNIKQINSIIKLRRDNDYNYEKVKNTFIPARGEPILVDTARNGLRIKIGDGITSYGNLNYQDDLFIQGYLYENNFYKDKEHTIIINGYENKLYISNQIIYYYDGTQYIPINETQNATETTFGVMKLYNNPGENIDGTMTQKAITDELKEKIEMRVNELDETVVFAYNL